jgi:NAD(P)-dependent dehydrogenase (short-subunit alcohol dehydrogenase family)
MAQHGARHIVLLSRSSDISSDVKQLADMLSGLGTNLIVRKCNVTKKSDVDELVSYCASELPPIKGLIHSAMVLHVSITEYDER